MFTSTCIEEAAFNEKPMEMCVDQNFDFCVQKLSQLVVAMQFYKFGGGIYAQGVHWLHAGSSTGLSFWCLNAELWPIRDLDFVAICGWHPSQNMEVLIVVNMWEIKNCTFSAWMDLWHQDVHL